MKPGRLWVPIDVTFWRDPQIVAAGEPAGVLYQVILGHLRATGARSGVLSEAEVPLLGVKGHAARLTALERVGLVQPVNSTLVLPAWESWQSTRAAYMRDWRKRQRGDDRPQDVVPP